ncbi:MAG TPA: hypothetical protein H9675_05370 [Firmicutes bacterium]|nr:hypothetical protein [Bacillota bacterium]
MVSISIYEFLCLLSVPTAIAGIVKLIIYYARRTSKKEYSVRKGIQALLRSQMISEYNKWSERGYAPIYARESFENCWQQYHALGANGVMDDIHERFLLLPTKEKED